MTTLKCQECGHENEIQRVYCHNCGTRLDRTTLVEAAEKSPKPVKPVRNGLVEKKIGRFIGRVIKSAFFAFLFACLLQAIRPPQGVPTNDKEVGGDIVDAPSIGMDMEESLAAPKRFGYTEAQLNAYLKSHIKPEKISPVPTWLETFNRAFVKLQPGAIRITKEYRVFTQPAFIGGTYAPSVSSGIFRLKPLQGNIGSLPIPGILFDLVDDFLFADFAKNMKDEAANANKMSAFEVTPKMVVITAGNPRK